ncbi:7-methylguanosine phosphate-specific 5'-nucleotidase [Portunus trituberculatus]|uniref:5'-nucleotidase n=1 Tax=Portunus trituberculatus TaxID=210409 RepID=A0A5B7DR10_PORTR|nr:7-methylguanosine phosphate-specific 5'-nucleotidase [Portunus trituberculatus]
MGDVLEQVLRHFKVYTDNVKVVSNFFKYNDQGIMVGFKGSLIHMFNKNEDAIHSSDYFEKLQNRTNVILMGDSLGDIKMALGVPQPSSVLKIGFLNDKIVERLPAFMDNFDIVLLDDQTMDVANSIVDLLNKSQLWLVIAKFFRSIDTKLLQGGPNLLWVTNQGQHTTYLQDVWVDLLLFVATLLLDGFHETNSQSIVIHTTAGFQGSNDNLGFRYKVHTTQVIHGLHQKQ